MVSVVGHHHVFKLEVAVKDAVAVQVLNCLPNLVGDFFYPTLRHRKRSELDVVKQIFTLHVFQNNVIVVRVL